MPLPQQDEFGAMFVKNYVAFALQSQCRFRSKMNLES